MLKYEAKTSSRISFPAATRFDLVKDHPTIPGFELYRVRMDRVDSGDLGNDDGLDIAESGGAMGTIEAMRVRIYRDHKLMRDETVSMAQARCIWARWAKRGLRKW